MIVLTEDPMQDALLDAIPPKSEIAAIERCVARMDRKATIGLMMLGLMGMMTGSVLAASVWLFTQGVFTP